MALERIRTTPLARDGNSGKLAPPLNAKEMLRKTVPSFHGACFCGTVSHGILYSVTTLPVLPAQNVLLNGVEWQSKLEILCRTEERFIL